MTFRQLKKLLSVEVNGWVKKEIFLLGLSQRHTSLVLGYSVTLWENGQGPDIHVPPGWWERNKLPP